MPQTAEKSSEQNSPNLSNSRPKRRDTVKRTSEPLSSFATARNVFSKFGQRVGARGSDKGEGEGEEFDLEEELVMTWKLPEDGIEPACDESEMDELRGKCEVSLRSFPIRKLNEFCFPLSTFKSYIISVFSCSFRIFSGSDLLLHLAALVGDGEQLVFLAAR